MPEDIRTVQPEAASFSNDHLAPEGGPPPGNSSDSATAGQHELKDPNQEQLLEQARQDLDRLNLEPYQESTPINDAMRRLHEASSDQDLEALLAESDLWDNPRLRHSTSLKLAAIYRQAKIEDGWNFTDAQIQFRGRVLESFGLSPEQAKATWRAWTTYSPLDEETGQLSRDKMTYFADEVLSANLDAMDRIESYLPGAIAQLQAPPYRIKHFRRYAQAQLAWQVDNPNAKVGRVIITAETDKTEALMSPGKLQRKIWGQSGSIEHEAVYLEAGTLEEARDALQETADARGRIQRLLLNAHGNEQIIELSRRQGGLIDESNIGDLVPENVVLPGCEAVLRNCMAGQGLDKAFHEATGIRTISSPGKPADVRRRRFRGPQFKNSAGEISGTNIYGAGKIRSSIRRAFGRLKDRAS